jgi:hypothetical protein
MASSAQVLANRDNAKLSTGPKTAEGKLASSRNSSRHGLTGNQIVMPGEDAAAYEELRQGMHDSWKPANEPELVLVDQIAAASWRLMRALRVETAVLEKLAEGSDNPDAAIAAARTSRESSATSPPPKMLSTKPWPNLPGSRKRGRPPSMKPHSWNPMSPPLQHHGTMSVRKRLRLQLASFRTTRNYPVTNSSEQPEQRSKYH